MKKEKQKHEGEWFRVKIIIFFFFFLLRYLSNFHFSPRGRLKIFLWKIQWKSEWGLGGAAGHSWGSIVVSCPAACTEEQGQAVPLGRPGGFGPFSHQNLHPSSQTELSWPPGLGWESLAGKALDRAAMRCQLIWEQPCSTARGDSGSNGLVFSLPSLIL